MDALNPSCPDSRVGTALLLLFRPWIEEVVLLPPVLGFLLPGAMRREGSGIVSCVSCFTVVLISGQHVSLSAPPTQHGLLVFSMPVSSCTGLLPVLPGIPGVAVPVAKLGAAAILIPACIALAGSSDAAASPRPMYAFISSSLTPLSRKMALSLLFSSSTLRAATCISMFASTPFCSHCRNLSSSSWRYSFRRARDRRWLSRMRSRCARPLEVGP